MPPAIDTRRTRSQVDVDDILQVGMLAIRQDPHAGDVGSLANDPFPKKKSQRQLALVARRPHHHRQRGTADTDFQRFLGGELVVDTDAGLLTVAKHPGAMRASILHGIDPSEHPPSGRRWSRH